MTVVSKGADLYASTIDVSEEIKEQQRDKTKIETQGEPECIQHQENTIFPFLISGNKHGAFFKGEIVHSFKEKGCHKNHGGNNRDKVTGRSVGHEEKKEGVGKKKEEKPDLSEVGSIFKNPVTDGFFFDRRGITCTLS